MRTRLVAACIAASCAAPARVEKPAPALEVKAYPPLGIRADAKAPHQALILGTDARDRSTLLPLPTAPGQVVVDAMATSALIPVRLDTAPNADGTLHVSAASSHEPGGAASPAARASVWMAAHAAATALDKDVTDIAFAASGGGAGGDVAASGLVAAGFLAALTGAAIDPRATLAASIQSDGTLGPVDALPERFAAALATGKKRIGYPAGMRNARSAKTGKRVDLLALAKRHGAHAVEVADVHAAYVLLTGKSLPAPQSVEPAAMALDAAITSWLDASYKQWQQQLAREWAGILQLESAGRLPASLVQLRDDAKRAAELAERLRQQNRPAAAHARMMAAVVDARSANRIYDVLANVQANKLDAALASLDQVEPLGDVMQTTFTSIAAHAPTTLGGHLQMLAALRAALRGWVFDDSAARARADAKTYLESLRGTAAATLGSEAIADAVVAHVAPAVRRNARAAAELALASEQLGLGDGGAPAYTLGADSAARLASIYRGLAAASMEYVDTALVDAIAARGKRAKGEPDAPHAKDEARALLAMQDPAYLVASTVARLPAVDGLPKELVASWGESSLPSAMLALAAGQLAAAHADELIAKYSASGVQLDGQRLRTIAPDRTLTAMLAAAERAARSHARAARVATGAIPVQARVAYQIALAEQDGPLAARIDALARFRMVSAWSQLAVALARN